MKNNEIQQKYSFFLKKIIFKAIEHLQKAWSHTFATTLCMAILWSAARVDRKKIGFSGY